MVHLPYLEEQQKIAELFREFYTVIEIVKYELECWKELEKGMLQQLFM